jgi:hypothetical protein
VRLVLVLLALTAAALAARPLVDGPAPAVPEAARDAGGAVRDAGRTAKRVAAPPTPPRVRCPSDADATCTAVRGRVVLVEAVDPDGDGDLHVVVADGSVTAPGFTSVDVRPGLRPDRDPRIGDVVSAAGPVQRGSFGQSQVHALRFRTAR